MNEFLRVLIRYVGCLYLLLILVQYGRFFLFQERRGEKGLDEGVEWRQTAETNAAERDGPRTRSSGKEHYCELDTWSDNAPHLFFFIFYIFFHLSLYNRDRPLAPPPTNMYINIKSQCGITSASTERWRTQQYRARTTKSEAGNRIDPVGPPSQHSNI